MNKTKLIGGLALFTALTLAVMNPAAASDKTTNTILGAGLGAAAGAILSEGDTLTTLGGAAAGGLLGNILTEEPRKRGHYGHRHSGPPHHARYNRGHSHKVHYNGHGKGKWKHHSKHRHHGKHHRHR